MVNQAKRMRCVVPSRTLLLALILTIFWGLFVYDSYAITPPLVLWPPENSIRLWKLVLGVALALVCLWTTVHMLARTFSFRVCGVRWTGAFPVQPGELTTIGPLLGLDGNALVVRVHAYASDSAEDESFFLVQNPGPKIRYRLRLMADSAGELTEVSARSVPQELGEFTFGRASSNIEVELPSNPNSAQHQLHIIVDGIEGKKADHGVKQRVSLGVGLKITGLLSAGNSDFSGATGDS